MAILNPFGADRWVISEKPSVGVGLLKNSRNSEVSASACCCCCCCCCLLMSGLAEKFPSLSMWWSDAERWMFRKPADKFDMLLLLLLFMLEHRHRV